MSSNLDLNVINYQDNLRSKPVRENFTNIQNEFNSLRAEVYASIASTASEVVSARDNFDNLGDNIHVRRVYGNRIYGTAGYKLTSLGGLRIRMASGQGIVNGVGVYHTTNVSATMTSPAAGYNRYDVAFVQTDNTRSVITGTETTGTAVIPSAADTQLPVARWHIFDTTGTLSITDLRYQALDPFLDENYSEIDFNFSGDTISTITLTDIDTSERAYKFNFSGDTISTIGITVGNIRYMQSFTFSGNTISNITTSLED